MQLKNLIPSLLAFPKDEWLKDLKSLENDGLKVYHFDVMDYEAVKNTAFNEDDLKLLEPLALKARVHLMVVDPFITAKKYLLKNLHSITFQFEYCSEDRTLETLNYLHQHKIKCGIAIKPDSKFETYSKFLDLCDVVTVMGVNPGFGGQKMLPESLINLQHVIDYKKNHHLNYYIEFDGGVNNETMKYFNNDVDFLVSGSYFYRLFKDHKLNE